MVKDGITKVHGLLGGVHLHYDTTSATQRPYVFLISDITIKLVVEQSHIPKSFKGINKLDLW